MDHMDASRHVSLSCFGSCVRLLHRSAQYAADSRWMNAEFTILTRSLVRMRMPLQAFRASSHLEYDSLVLHREESNASDIKSQMKRESSKQTELRRTITSA